MFVMKKEIFQQPEVIRRILREEKNRIQKIGDLIRKREIKVIIIAARGTSDNAAILAKYLFEYINGIPVSLAFPSLYTIYNAKLKLDDCLVVGISQSGEAPDVIEVIKESKNKGALTLGITNKTDSTLAQSVDFLIHCQAGEEKSIAATKTYTAEIVILYLLSAIMANNTIVNKLEKIPDFMEKILSLDEYIKERIERYRYLKECVVIARGFNLATAQEFALKLKETSYLLADAFSAADFLHGPIVLLEEGFPVIVIAPKGETYRMMIETTKKIKDKKAELIVVSNGKKILSMANVPLQIPVDIEEIFSPIIYILFCQLFAYHLSIIKGYSPDKPRYLKKITRTK